ncbi:Lipase maturation factor 1 [Armadillidium vulgare]|nr:Lipase maturation factor 1 [Armadillidium vulgare]
MGVKVNLWLDSIALAGATLSALIFISGSSNIIFLFILWILYHSLVNTQPVPNPLSYYLHQSPSWIHKGETFGNHIVECVIPFFAFLPRIFQIWCGIIQILFQRYEQNPWLVHLAGRLLRNDDEISGLIEYNPFLDENRKPPLYIKADLYLYNYAPIGSAEAARGQWYKRKYVRNYLPPVNLKLLKSVFREMGWQRTR